MPRIISLTSKLAIIVAVSGCGFLTPGGIERTYERSFLVGSSGPQLDPSEITTHLEAYKNLRLFTNNSLSYGDLTANEIGIVNGTVNASAEEKTRIAKKIASFLARMTAIPIPTAELVAVRDMAFGYVDARCTAYLDAIFWTRRAEKTWLSDLSAAAGATGSILAATGAAASTIGIVASAFGLGSTVVETGFEKFLYSIEPSGLVSITEKAQSAYLANLPTPGNEAQALRQVQGYILLCTPVKLEALVNEAVKNATVETRSTPSKKLTQAENDRYNILAAMTKYTQAEAEEMARLKARLYAAGVEPVPRVDPAPAAIVPLIGG